MDNQKDEKKQSQSVEQKKQYDTQFFIDLMKKSESFKESKQPSKDQKSKDNKEFYNYFNKVYYIFASILNKFNVWIDIMLKTTSRICILSLFLTLVIFFVVNGPAGMTTTQSIDLINDVPVTVKVKDHYEMVNYDDTVTVQLIGDFSSIQWAKVMKEYKVVLDGTEKAEGNFELYYRVEGLSNQLDVKVVPESTKVNISKIETRTFEVESKIYNESNMDPSITLKDPKLAFSNVEVTAGTTTLNKISRVVAKIDASEISQSVRDGKAPLVALDDLGNELNVTLSPSEVDYDLDVVTTSKLVPIRLEVHGKVNDDYILTSLTPSVDAVTIYGLQENLDKVKEVVAVVDVSGYSSDIQINGIALSLPNEVVRVSEKTISVALSLSKKATKTIDNLPIQLESLKNGYSASLVSQATATVEVIGPKDKITALKPQDIKVYVSLADATPGVAKYELIVANEDKSMTYVFKNITSVDVAVKESE